MKNPQPDRRLSDFVRETEERLHRLEHRSPFAGLNLRPTDVGTVTLEGVTLTPSDPGVVFDSADNFALTTTFANVLSGSLTVPDGYVTAAISVVSRVFAFNDTASLDYLRARPVIAATTGTAVPLAVSASGGSGTNIAPLSVVLEGLTGGESVTFAVEARTDFAGWAADAANYAELSGTVQWFK